MAEIIQDSDASLKRPPWRVVSWFSCGASSAVAAKKAIEKYGPLVSVVYCDTMKDEHPDNARFFGDVETWLGQPIHRIASTAYHTIDEVFLATRYMSGIKGARCTTELKKVPRFAYQQPDDLNIFGFTVEEAKRIAVFESRNPELQLEWILRDIGITKRNCFDILAAAGIQLPTLYLMGYRNNNCLGCVKSSSPGYWSKIRRDFPQVFEERAGTSRKLGVRLVRIKGVRIFLDELPNGDFPYHGENISCGPECGGGNDE